VAPPSAPKTKPGTIVVRGATQQPSPALIAPHADAPPHAAPPHAAPPHAAPPHAAPARPVASPKQPVTPPPVAPTPPRAAPPPPPVTLPPPSLEPTFEEEAPRFDPEFSPPLENLGPEPPFVSDPEPLYEPEPAYEPEPEAEPDPEYEREPEPEPETEPETEPEIEEVVPRTHEERVRQSAADEFLRNSPVLRAEARPLKREERRHMPQPASAVATALTALASEVGTLGVPEGQRAGARAALLDLARQLDDHTLSWSSLRESMQFVMEYPALARRVVPLLIPYLDVAA
jgi:hypothetical protein